MLGYVLKLKYLLVLLISFAICFLVIQFYLFSELHPQIPILLWWTPFMGEYEQIIKCHEYNCLLSKDRKYVNDSKAFLFYGSKFEMTDLPIPKMGKWALIHEESPRNVGLFLYNQTYDLFEIISTFSRHSDFPLTLQYLENLSIITDSEYTISIKDKNEYLSSIAPVLYIQSDCDTPNERDNYVQELMKHIQVDSYGACLNNKKFPQEIADIYALDLYNPKLLKFIAKYKFIIAFENAICDDYITEKLWRPLAVGSIPIYLGSPSVQDWLPNKNSAILVKTFANPQSLAAHIYKINRNDVLYDSFLEHKRGIVKNNFLKQALSLGPFGLDTDQEHPISAFECFVCLQIHKTMVQKNLRKSVYNCAKPKGNSWEYHWQVGECQSRLLFDSVKNNVKLTSDPC